MSPILSVFLNLIKCTPVSNILTVKTTISAIYSGDVIIPFQEVYIRLKNVPYTQELGFSFVPIGILDDHGIETVFGLVMVLRKDGVVIGKGRRVPKSNLFNVSNPVPQNPVTCALVPLEENIL